MKTSIYLTLTALVAAAVCANGAGIRDRGVNARQRNQQERIAEGAKSGQLTGREAVRLQREERAVRTEERAYKADGKLTPAERKDLNQDLNKVSRDIYKQKHDAQTQPGVAPAAPGSR